MKTWLGGAAALVCMAAPPVAAQQGQFVNENLIVALPQTYELGYRTQNGGAMLFEFVPKGQKVETWRELITITVDLNGPQIAPGDYLQRFAASWKDACPGASHEVIASDRKNSYPGQVSLLGCDLLADTGKPEWTLVKAIEGKDAFYTVQKAFRYQPSAEEVRRWSAYLGGVFVCDTRIAGRDCPKLPQQP